MTRSCKCYPICAGLASAARLVSCGADRLVALNRVVGHDCLYGHISDSRVSTPVFGLVPFALSRPHR